jgi:hypothetical protein
MRTLAISLLLLTAILCATGSASAQTQLEVEVVKADWRKLAGSRDASAQKDKQMRIGQLNSMIGMEMQKDPKDQDLGAIARLREERQRIEQNQVTIDSFNRSNKAYQYRFKFKNHGKKEVVALAWVYVFTDSVSGNELSRLRFGSRARLGPGKETSLTAYSDSSPPQVVNAQAAEKTGKFFKEIVIIEKLEFSDGSRWAKTGS